MVCTKHKAAIPVKIRLHKHRFRTIIATRCRQSAHSGSLETSAVSLGLQWLAKNPKYHSHRVVFLVDAQAVLDALAKGRSSAPTLFRGVKQCAALLLSTDTMARWVCISSEHNPADPPSRGIVLQHRRPRSRSIHSIGREPSYRRCMSDQRRSRAIKKVLNRHLKLNEL